MGFTNFSAAKKIFFLLALLIGLGILTFPAKALTADEYFEFASDKYLQGDISGAVSDIRKGLKVDPHNKGIQELKRLIEEEYLIVIDAPAVKKTPEVAAPPVVESPVTPVDKIEPGVPHPSIKAEWEAKFRKAHKIFVAGERYFDAGEYGKARANFVRVQDILGGHRKSRTYLKKIALKLSSLTPEAVALAGRGAQKYDFRFLLLILLLSLFFILILVLFGWIFHRWRTKYVSCSECGAHNPEEAEFCHKCRERLKLPSLTEIQKRWFDKFGWKKNPFTLNIISNVYAGHKAEIAIITEKLNTLSGHILIVGGLGTGKTTLLQWLEKNLTKHFETIYVSRPPKRPDELIDLISATITNKTSHTIKYSLFEFQNLCKKFKRNILLLIDEAHEFGEGFERYLRTLGDLSNIFLVMAGLPQVREELKRNLPALFDRIVESVLLGSLTREETQELIEKRIRNAKGQGLGPFTAAAIDRIYEISYGIPRGILKVCDWVVTQAMRANKTFIDVQDVDRYIKEIEAAELRHSKDSI